MNIQTELEGGGGVGGEENDGEIRHREREIERGRQTDRQTDRLTRES